MGRSRRADRRASHGDGDRKRADGTDGHPTPGFGPLLALAALLAATLALARRREPAAAHRVPSRRTGLRPGAVLAHGPES